MPPRSPCRGPKDAPSENMRQHRTCANLPAPPGERANGWAAAIPAVTRHHAGSGGQQPCRQRCAAPPARDLPASNRETRLHRRGNPHLHQRHPALPTAAPALPSSEDLHRRHPKLVARFRLLPLGGNDDLGMTAVGMTDWRDGGRKRGDESGSMTRPGDDGRRYDGDVIGRHTVQDRTPDSPPRRHPGRTGVLDSNAFPA